MASEPLHESLEDELVPEKEDDDAKSEAIPIQKAAMKLVPHRDVVFADFSESEDSTVVVHKLTLERLLFAGEWRLEFDDEGYGCLYNLDGQTKLLENTFRRQLHQSEANEQYVRVLDKGYESYYRLSDQMRRFVSQKLEIGKVRAVSYPEASWNVWCS